MTNAAPARSSSISSTITVRVRNLAVGGDGVGEVTAQNDGQSDLLGITAFVPFTAPGEIVEARVSERKKNYVRAEIVELVEASVDRVEPPCRYYMQCGGCELQHVDYAAQLDWKLQMIRGALAAGKCSQEALERLNPIVRSEPYGYRRRISLHVDRTGSIGFYRPGTRSVVPIQSCTISAPGINETLEKLPVLAQKICAKISSIVLECDATGVVAVMKSPYDLSKSDVDSVLKPAREVFDSALVVGNEVEKGGFGRKILELSLNERASLTLRVPAGSFSQVNWEINRALIKAVCDEVQPNRELQVFDLYSGAGNFAIPLAAAGARVTAVECDKNLVQLGRQNCSRYSLERNLRYVESSVEKFLDSLSAGAAKEVVVADPPRSGLGALVARFADRKKVILVSCHLPSFVRDTRALLDLGFSVKSITPFDMFAQTSYVEILSVFEK